MMALIRLYLPSDRMAIRQIFGADEFARPQLLRKYPRFSEYLADEMSYYPDFEPESLFISDVGGQVVGALLGAVDTGRSEQVYRRWIRPRLVWRGLKGAYGWPGWYPAILCTEWAQRNMKAPRVDCKQYPAHLHIGIMPVFRRQGLGTALMEKFTEYLHSRNIPGYHLYASSYHSMGVPFYHKLGLELLGQFDWRLHTGYEWVNVTERLFGKRVA